MLSTKIFIVHLALIGITIARNDISTSSHSNSVECGHRNNGMRSGPGGTSSPLYYPWMVSIAKGKGKSFCGGTLINQHQILTAGHCVSDIRKPGDLRVIIGVHDLQDVRQEDTVKPKAIRLHPGYKFIAEEKIYENDLAILEIPPVEFAPNIRPICLPENNIDLKLNTDDELTVLGWGQLSPEDRGAEVLQELSLPLIANDKCGQVWGVNLDQARFFCHGQNDKNICQGDDGGPLMHFDEVKEQWTLIGVASTHGATCGDKYPGIYTKISSYKEWLKEV